MTQTPPAKAHMAISKRNSSPLAARTSAPPPRRAPASWRLRAALRLDGIYVCWHDDADRCNCRKPQPGLLLEAARHHNVDLAHSFMIGDRWRDVAAGQKAGCRTIWIKNDYDEREPAPPIDYVADGLADAVDWILESTGIAR